MKQAFIYLAGFLLIALLAVFIFEAGRSYQFRLDEASYINRVIAVDTNTPLLIERIMDIQREVGCKLIDGEIGPESKEKINAKTEPQKIILYNRYASKYFTPSGRPK